jgi:cold shock CspA family protein
MSSSSSSDTASSVDTTTRFTGVVKWFNNKAGFGFVTVLDNDVSGDYSGKDVFSHHTSCNVTNKQYRYLVQGEYVEFTLKESENSDHPYQADDISGICGGKLMCETRWEVRQQRDAEMAESGDSDESVPRRSGRRVRPRGSGPRDGQGWSSSSGKRRAPKRVSQSESSQ